MPVSTNVYVVLCQARYVRTLFVSQLTSSSVAATRARAKAETARVRLSFAQKEAKIFKQQAEQL